MRGKMPLTLSVLLPLLQFLGIFFSSGAAFEVLHYPAFDVTEYGFPIIRFPASGMLLF
jgi:hypothetical protein